MKEDFFYVSETFSKPCVQTHWTIHSLIAYITRNKPIFTHLTLLFPTKTNFTHTLALKRAQNSTTSIFTTKQRTFIAYNLPKTWKFKRAALRILMKFCMSDIKLIYVKVLCITSYTALPTHVSRHIFELLNLCILWWFADLLIIWRTPKL